jgi:Uma2 family endonuclease
MRLIVLLSQQVGHAAILNVQNPLVLDDYTEPQPDLMLLRPRRDFYSESHPTPAAILLVIEVADSSRLYDETVKVPLYARAGIPAVWLFDLSTKRVKAYAEPLNGAYTHARVVQPGETLTLLSVPGLALRVDEVWDR